MTCLIPKITCISLESGFCFRIGIPIWWTRSGLPTVSTVPILKQNLKRLVVGDKRWTDLYDGYSNLIMSRIVVLPN